MVTKDKYLQSLKKELLAFGLSPKRISVIISDYEDYFESAYDNFEKDTDIVNNLGSAQKLAKRILSEQIESPMPHIQINASMLIKYPKTILPTLFY